MTVPAPARTFAGSAPWLQAAGRQRQPSRIVTPLRHRTVGSGADCIAWKRA